VQLCSLSPWERAGVRGSSSQGQATVPVAPPGHAARQVVGPVAFPDSWIPASAGMTDQGPGQVLDEETEAAPPSSQGQATVPVAPPDHAARRVVGPVAFLDSWIPASAGMTESGLPQE